MKKRTRRIEKLENKISQQQTSASNQINHQLKEYAKWKKWLYSISIEEREILIRKVVEEDAPSDRFTYLVGGEPRDYNEAIKTATIHNLEAYLAEKN